MDLPGTQPLETPRLRLRRFVPGDAPALYAGCTSQPQCFAYLPWEPDISLEQTRRRIASWCGRYTEPDGFQWAIEERSSGALAGYVNLHGVEPQNRAAETTYFLAPEAWGKGYMTEALEAVLAFAFDRAGFRRISADHFVGNDASGRVLERCGMRREGVARERYEKHGRTYDSVLFAILQRDWKARTERN